MISVKVLSKVFLAFYLLGSQNSVCDEVDEVDAPKDCVIKGQFYKHGQKFNMGCTARCTCQNGGFSCVSLCPPFGMPERCRFLKKMGNCCLLGHCPEELFRDDCFIDHEHMHLADDLVPQWSVVLTSNDHPDQACLGTLLNQKNIYTSPECKFVNGNATMVDYSQHDIDAGLEPTYYEANLTTKGSILRANKIELTLEVRDTNFPFSENCDRRDCVLFIPSFDSVANRTLLLKGYEVAPKHCALTPTDTSSGVRCVELLHLGPTPHTCVNLAGSGVSVKSGNIFFLRGYVVDQPKFSPTSKTKCPELPIKFIKYLDECKYLANEAQPYFT